MSDDLHHFTLPGAVTSSWLDSLRAERDVRAHRLETDPMTLLRPSPVRSLNVPRWMAGLAVLAGVALAPSSAAAQDSAYCRKVRARAVGDAALLFAPSVQGQAIRFPTQNGGAVDTGVTTGSGFQARAGLTWSPLDFYRGFRVLRAGDADCERGEAQITAQHLLRYGEDYGRLHALRKQAEFLEGRTAALSTIMQKNEERLESHVTSLLDANEVRARAAELSRKSVQARGEVARLEARGVDSYRGMLTSLLASLESSNTKYEKEVSHLRTLDGWDLRVSAGVIPQEKPDYYGYVQLGFNFGTFARNASESRYLDARTEELRKARYELRDQLERFREQVKVTSKQAKTEEAIVKAKLDSLASARKALATSDSPNAPHALAVIDLELVGTEAEHVFLTALVMELASLEDHSHGK